MTGKRPARSTFNAPSRVPGFFSGPNYARGSPAEPNRDRKGVGASVVPHSLFITRTPPTRTIQNPPRLSPRMLPLINNHLPVHQHIIDPLRRERGFLKSRPILDPREIENHSIRPHSFFDRST